MSIFGKEFEQVWPKAGCGLQLTDFGKKLLKQCENIKKPEETEVDINEFKRQSSNFPLEVTQAIRSIFFLIVYITYFYLPPHSSAPIPVESWVNPKTDIPLYRSRLPQPIRWYTKEFCNCIWTFWNTNANMVSAIYNKKTPGRHHTLFPLL